MSFNTTLRTNLVFNHKTYQSKSQVEEALEFRTMNMHDTLWELLRKNINLDSTELNRLTAELEDVIIDKFKLEMLLNDWDKCHTEDGKAIQGEHKQDPEIWGDFIDKTLEDFKG